MKNIVIILILSVPAMLFGQSSIGIIEEELAAISYDELVQEYNRTVSLESRNANIRGFDAYEAGDYGEAVRLWEEAIILDKDNHFAHFNIACGKSLLSARDGVDRTDGILFHIQEAAKFSNYWVLKTFTDPDLNAVRGEPIHRSIVFPSPGDLGHDIYYYFFPDGWIMTGYNYPDLRGPVDGDDNWTEFPGPAASTWGYYTMIGNTAVIYLPEGNVIDEFWYEMMFPGEEPEIINWIILYLGRTRFMELEPQSGK